MAGQGKDSRPGWARQGLAGLGLAGQGIKGVDQSFGRG